MWRYAGRGRDTSQWGLMVGSAWGDMWEMCGRYGGDIGASWWANPNATQVGSAFQLVLDDLEREGFEEEAGDIGEMCGRHCGNSIYT